MNKGRYQDRVLELQQERLQEFSDNQQRWLNSIQIGLFDYLENLRRQPKENWHSIQNDHRLAQQLFEIDSEGELTWPNSTFAPLTENEAAFKAVYEAGNLLLTESKAEDATAGSPFHWSTWFEGPGQQWAYWVKEDAGTTLGVVIDRTAFMSEAIAQLPDTPDSSLSSRTAPETFQLVNETGELLYLWGAAEIETNTTDFISVSLPHPLNTWQVKLISQVIATPPWYQQPLVLSMAASIFGLAVVTLIAAYYLYTETRREFQRAQQRVSFVNQVSHEFKTPLTNIQLYSELLDESIETDTGNKYLNIIQEETHKLRPDDCQRANLCQGSEDDSQSKSQVLGS